MERQELKKIPLNVLLVEDNINIRENTFEILKRRIEHVVIASNGVEGLNQYKSNQFDVVISDIKMPKMDGLEMANQIRIINPGQHIIIISAYIGVDGFVLKPLQWNRLIDLIKKTADSIRLEKELKEKNILISEKQAQLESMLNSSVNVAIISTDLHFSITNFNQTLNTWLLCKNRNAVNINDSILDLWLNDNDHLVITNHLKKALEGQPVIGLEDSPWDQQTETKYDISIWPVHNQDSHTITGLTVIINDITERKKNQEQLENYQNHLEELVKKRTGELLESEFRYKNLIERLNDGLMIIHENDILYANPALGKLIGVDSDTLAGKEILSIVSRKESASVNKIHQDRLKGKEMPEIYETVLISADETTVPVELNVSRVNQADSSSHIVIIRDLRHRHAIEHERSKLAIAVGQIAEGIVITDTDGIIEYVNNSFCRITQYDDLEVIGKKTNILKSGEQPQQFYQLLWQTINAGQTWSGVIINKRKDGSLYHEHCVISPIADSFGKVVNFVAVKRDITNDLMLERKMRQTQKLQAIGTLAGGIAHGFNNLLMGMSVFTELAINDLDETNPVRDYLIQIRNEQQRAISLIEKILLFSRQKEEVVQEIRIKKTALEFIEMLSATLPTSIEIDRQIEEVGLLVMDPTHLQQILINLFNNANYAMQGQGKITIIIDIPPLCDVPRMNQIQEGVDKWLRISVRDNGCGIEPKYLDRIFEPFFTTKPVGEGTGLGLATVHGIVENYNGYIEVNSLTGSGTTFTIYLPFNKNTK